MSNDVDYPSHVRPLAAKVEALAGFGISAGDIAGVLGLGEDELRQDYTSEFDCGTIRVNAKVAESLFRKATGEGSGAVSAAIFWLKTRARWRETHVHEYASKPDLPLDVIVTIGGGRRRP